MITSRFPFWRTNPAGFGVTGYWPILTGCFAVLALPPLLGWLADFLANIGLDPSSPLRIRIRGFSTLLVSSPYLSWVALLFAIPISAALAARGFAGWGIALLGGALLSLTVLGSLILIAAIAQDSSQLFMTSVASLLSLGFTVASPGILLAMTYWAAIRIVHPSAIGIVSKTVTQNISPQRINPMITSRYPVWRTNPAGFGVRWYWPMLTGALAVLVVVPLIGILFNAILYGLTLGDHARLVPLKTAAAVITLTFMFSWAPLIVALPLSAALARDGYAGWGFAVIAGILGGFITAAMFAGRLNITSETLALSCLGAFVALIYWGAIRLIHPATIGVAIETPPQ